MRALCIVDTSVFCELIKIPGLCSQAENFEREWKKRIKAGERFLVPLATLIETGNHIGQISDGTLRREAARRFVGDVRVALEGRAPYVIVPEVSVDTVREWCDSFVAWSVQGSGLGDLSIQLLWARQNVLHPDRRVYVWALDRHLQAYDTGARGP